jgi:scyllo-inositol 2-dehydrogenase (NADP+)
VAVVGLGRSGWKNHVKTLAQMPEQFRLQAVVDPESRRRSAASRLLGVRAFADIETLLAEDDAQLVVVATPSHLHAPHTVRAALAGRMVVCEKPMGINIDEASEIMAAGRIAPLFTVFSNYRFTPDFLTVRRVLASGVLGDPLTLRLAISRFGRRRDWQTLNRLGGGILRNSGWHLIDQALALLKCPDQLRTAQILGQVACAWSPGDAEDYAKLVMHVDGVLVDIEVSDVSPFPTPRWSVMGTKGALSGEPRSLAWRYLRDDALDIVEVEAGPARARAYEFEEAPYVEERWSIGSAAVTPPRAFYEELAGAIQAGGPPPVTIESAYRVMKVIDTVLRP